MAVRWEFTLSLVVLVAGCSSTPAAPATTLRQTGLPPVTAWSSEAIPTSGDLSPVSPATLTAGCPFLTGDELRLRLGSKGLDGATIDLIEGSRSTDNDHVTVSCTFSVNGESKYTLIISGLGSKGFAVPDAVNGLPKGAKDVKALPGIGEAAISYLSADDLHAVINTGKRSHGETRTATFVAPYYMLQEQLAHVAELVVERL